MAKGLTLEELQKLGATPASTGRGLTLQELQSMQGQSAPKQDGFLKTLIKDPIKTLLVKPADRFAEAVGRTGVLGSSIKRGYEEMADAGTSRRFMGIDVEAQKASNAGGLQQIVGDAAKATSYLYTGGTAPTAAKTALSGQVKQGMAQGLKLGTVGGGTYAFGDAIQDAEAQPAEIAYRTLFGAGVGAVTGLTLGAATPIVVKGVNGVKRFANIDTLNQELTTLNRTTLRPNPSQQRKWSEQGVDPIKTYTEIFETKIPQVDKSNKFIPESVEEFVDKVDQVYRPGAEGFNTILRNSPEITNLSNIERSALSRVETSNLTPSQKALAKRRLEDEFVALRNEVGDTDNIPVALSDNYKDRYWSATRYFGSEESGVTNEVNRALGRSFAEAVESTVKDVNVKQYNKQLQELIVLKDFLASLAGKNAGSGGKPTRFVGRVLGAVTLAQGGPLASIAGGLTGDVLAQIWMNPAYSPYRWMILKQLQKMPAAQRKTLEQQANEVIEEMWLRRQNTPALPAPSFIPMGGSTDPTKYLGTPSSQTPSAPVPPSRRLMEQNPIILPGSSGSFNNGAVRQTAKSPNQKGSASMGGITAGAAGLAGLTALAQPRTLLNYQAQNTAQSTPATTTPSTAITKIKNAIAYNETRGEKDPYSFSRFSGSKAMGRALGKYQVTEGMLKTYSQKFLGRTVTPQEFLANPKLQDEFVIKEIEHLQKMGYSVAEVLAAHRGGFANPKQKVSQYKGYVNAGMKFLKEN